MKINVSAGTSFDVILVKMTSSFAFAKIIDRYFLKCKITEIFNQKNFFHQTFRRQSFRSDFPHCKLIKKMS